MLNFNNKIQILSNLKMIHRLNKRLSDTGLYNFAMIQDH
mgnify:CR=1 FL=1